MVVERKTNKWYDMDETIICIKNTGEFIFSDNPDYMDCLYWEKKDDYLPKLTIGQCIELLGIRLKKIDYDGFINNYYVQTNTGTNGKPKLIDALFAAVKEVL